MDPACTIPVLRCVLRDLLYTAERGCSFSDPLDLFSRERYIMRRLG